MRGLTWEQEWAALVAVALALLFVRAIALTETLPRLDIPSRRHHGDEIVVKNSDWQVGEPYVCAWKWSGPSGAGKVIFRLSGGVSGLLSDIDEVDEPVDENDDRCREVLAYGKRALAEHTCDLPRGHEGVHVCDPWVDEQDWARTVWEEGANCCSWWAPEVEPYVW